jgi:(p)ppGpp synthase/HD superfamily hydrolase
MIFIRSISEVRMDDKILEAMRIAKEAHGDQMYGDRPYIEHCLDVYEILRSHFFQDTDLLVASILHDTIEDTTLSDEEIWMRFGSNVARLVSAVTAKHGNRKARTEQTIEQLLANPAAIPVKLADRIANVTRCWEESDTRLFMYQREYRQLRSTLRPFSLQMPGVRSLWDRLDTLLGWHEKEQRRDNLSV